MFGKLRLKLALLNSAVAGFILLVLAAMVYLFVSQIISQQSDQELRGIARDVEQSSFSSSSYSTAPGRGSLYPFIVVQANEDMQFSPVAWFGVDLNESQLKELIQLAISTESQASTRAKVAMPNGVVILHRPHHAVLRLANGELFRYEITGIRPGATNVYFIFMDIRHEQQLRASVLLALGGSVLGGLILTLLGGFFLAGRALKPVRTAWHKQRAFVADASHELRSPLAAIRCNLDVVLDNPDEPVKEKQLYWEGISEETARMSTLVDELLLLARADSNAVTMQKEKVDLAALAMAEVPFMQPLAQKNGVELRLETPVPVFALGDPARLKQVLIALIDNALKYTPAGGSVTVTVRRAKDKAILEVSDTGIGIPKEHINKIFERFYRADKARERESGGYGLGLSIAHWIVSQHGGTISVASEEGKGSTFTVGLKSLSPQPPPP